MDPYGLRVDLFKNYIGRIDALMGPDGCQKDFYESSSGPIWAHIAPACGSYGPRGGPMWILAARQHPSEIFSPGSIDRFGILHREHCSPFRLATLASVIAALLRVGASGFRLRA